MNVALETVIDEISQTVVAMSNKVVEHNQVLAQALEDIISLAELCKGLRERVEALETHVKGMSSAVGDITVACDRERIDELWRDMMNRTDPRKL